MRWVFRAPPHPGADGHSRALFTLAQCVPITIALLVVVIQLSPAHFLYTGPLLTIPHREKGAQIGGDLYEAVQTRYGIRLIIGDVRGKGLSAVRSAAAVVGAFREAAHYEEKLVEVVDRCAAALRREYAVPGAVDREAQVEGFVTMLVTQVPERVSHRDRASAYASTPEPAPRSRHSSTGSGTKPVVRPGMTHRGKPRP